MRPNRPHIPSSFHPVKEHTQRTKTSEAASFPAYPRPLIFQIFRTSASFLLSLRRRFRPSPSLFRFGEAVFTEERREPQEGKMRFCRFFSFFRIFPQNLGVGAIFGTSDSHPGQHSIARHALMRCGPAHGHGCARGGPARAGRQRPDRASVPPATLSPALHSGSRLPVRRHR